jgi:hypothetical protein
MLAALERMATLKTSLGCIIPVFKDPIEMVDMLFILFLESRQTKTALSH